MRKVNYFTLALACFQIAAYSQTVPYPGDGPSVYVVRVISVGSAEKDAFVACLKAVETSVLRITKNPPPPMFRRRMRDRQSHRYRNRSVGRVAARLEHL